MKSSAKIVHPELTPMLLWVMAIATGLIVANLYYNQPLLGAIASTFHVSSAKAGQVAVLTQIGYATGMLFIAPLADMHERKRLIMICLAVAIISLLCAAMAPGMNILVIVSYLIGIFSIIPQLLIPMTAHLAKPAERGRKLGFVTSGLLLGILLSRVISGIVDSYLGWRAMFYIAAGIMVVIWVLLFFLLPEVEPEYKGSYKSLMRSMITLIKTEPILRIATARGALCFACFSAFWTTLVFLLGENFQPLMLSLHNFFRIPVSASLVAGLFGLVGAFGALAAGIMGRLSDRMDAYKLSTFTLLLVILSFVLFFFSAYSLTGLIIGVIVMDMGVQGTHISNQTLILALKPGARNRINTIYIVTYFTGGALGTLLASEAWKYWQWNGVSGVGITLSAIAVAFHLLNKKNFQKIRQSV